MRPMTEAVFFVLAALLDGPRHGYGIIGDVAELSDDRVHLPVGTLYGVLERLVRDGQVEPDRDEVHDGRLRRYYRITDEGRQALSRETSRQARNARTVAALLAPGARAPQGGGA